MSLVSQTRSTLNPNAPLFIPAAVRQVEDYSPEWWQLVTTSTWFHDYWLSQQQEQGAYGFIGNTPDDTDIVDMLPDSIDIPDYDLSAMDADFVRFMDSIGLESENTFGKPIYKKIPSNGLETEAEMLRSLSLSRTTPGSQREMQMDRHPERAVRSFSPSVRSQRIQQPR